MIMAHIERSKFIADFTTGYKTDGVFPQREVQVNISFYIELSDCFSGESHFTNGMVMKYISFTFG